MNEIIQLGDFSIQVTRKAIKHVHLSVHPPLGRVTLVAPKETRLDVARLRHFQIGLDSGAAVETALPGQGNDAHFCHARNALSMGATLSPRCSLRGRQAIHRSRPPAHHSHCATGLQRRDESRDRPRLASRSFTTWPLL